MTRQTVAMEVSKLMSVSVSTRTKNTVGKFKNGSEAGICLIMSGSAGVFLLKDPFHDAYWADNGGNNPRRFGYPISDQYQNGALIQQDFEGGFMTYDTENGEVSIYQKTKR